MSTDYYFATMGSDWVETAIDLGPFWLNKYSKTSDWYFAIVSKQKELRFCHVFGCISVTWIHYTCLLSHIYVNQSVKWYNSFTNGQNIAWFYPDSSTFENSIREDDLLNLRFGSHHLCTFVIVFNNAHSPLLPMWLWHAWLGVDMRPTFFRPTIYKHSYLRCKIM
jgi:hypothetical protein